MIPFVNVVIAIVPSMLILLWAYRRDTARHESAKVVMRAFFLGFIAIVAAIAVGFAVAPIGNRLSRVGDILFRAFIVAALVEECAKFAVVRLFIERHPDFDEVADGLVYTMATSLGFALLENAFYITGPTFTLILRGITAVPLHAACGGLMGFFVGRGHFANSRVSFYGLASAVMLHGIYDALLFTGSLWSLAAIPLLIGAGFLVAALFRHAVRLDRSAGRVPDNDAPPDNRAPDHFQY